MYKYIYVEAKAKGFFKPAEHREIIDRYSQAGWRFVSAIPTDFGVQGMVVKYDLVFEKDSSEI